MPRDKNALTDKELYKDTASIVENVKDTTININLTTKAIGFMSGGGDNHDTKREHQMILGNIKGVEKFTLLNHELGHVMFDSPM